MLTSFWRQVTLSGVAFDQWRNASILHQLLWPLRKWRQGSWLLPVGDWLGLAIVMVLYALAPYVSTTLIGGAHAGGSRAVGIADPNRRGPGGHYSHPRHGCGVLGGVMVLATALSPVRGAAISGLIKLHP